MWYYFQINNHQFCLKTAEVTIWNVSENHISLNDILWGVRYDNVDDGSGGAYVFDPKRHWEQW